MDKEDFVTRLLGKSLGKRLWWLADAAAILAGGILFGAALVWIRKLFHLSDHVMNTVLRVIPCVSLVVCVGIFYFYLRAISKEDD
jgi:hypothetical protein